LHVPRVSLLFNGTNLGRSMSAIVVIAGSVAKAAKDAVRSQATPNDISDEQFIKDLQKLKELRSFLIEQAIQLQPTETASISFGKLNLLRFRDDGRVPNEEEWELLERLTHGLFRQLDEPLRRRFLYSRTPAWFAPLVMGLGGVAIVSLVSCTLLGEMAVMPRSYRCSSRGSDHSERSARWPSLE
jgi:hypothetical protein